MMKAIRIHAHIDSKYHEELAVFEGGQGMKAAK